jgi:hypothetical protein
MTPDTDFIYFFTLALLLGLFDFYLWISRKPTISQRIWNINQWTLALAYLFGFLSGHFFTIPK